MLQPDARLNGLIGPISQVIQAPPDLKSLLKQPRGRLQDVVVTALPDAEKRDAYLKQNRAGRATFLLLDTIRPGPAITLPEHTGRVGSGPELVTVEPRLRPIAELRPIAPWWWRICQPLAALLRPYRAAFRLSPVRANDAPGGAVGVRRSAARQRWSFWPANWSGRELPAQLAEPEFELTTLCLTIGTGSLMSSRRQKQLRAQLKNSVPKNSQTVSGRPKSINRNHSG
ncbi:MAG: hypothetical protein U0401_29340 [Anaerolineae bacterium]